MHLTDGMWIPLVINIADNNAVLADNLMFTDDPWIFL